MANGFQSLLATKATGKAQAPSGPSQSNIGQQVAEQQAGEQQAQVQESIGLEMQQQEAQRDAIQEETTQQNMALKFREEEQQVSNMQEVQGLLQNAEFSELELESRRDALNLETAAHRLMMEDQSYIHQIREVGRRRRLTNELTFQEEMDRMVYGEELSMLMDELGWMEQQGQLARDRSDELFNMNMDIALAVAAADLEQAQTQMIGQGIMDAGTAIAKDKKASAAIAGAFKDTGGDPDAVRVRGVPGEVESTETLPAARDQDPYSNLA